MTIKKKDITPDRQKEIIKRGINTAVAIGSNWVLIGLIVFFGIPQLYKKEEVDYGISHIMIISLLSASWGACKVGFKLLSAVVTWDPEERYKTFRNVYICFFFVAAFHIWSTEYDFVEIIALGVTAFTLTLTFLAARRERTAENPPAEEGK